jgi:hypothetical protein
MSVSIPPPASAEPAGESTRLRWARLADVLTAGLFVLALVVFEWGGFRVRFGDTRLALTSSWRLLIAGALLSVVRHYFVRSPAVYVDLPLRISSGLRLPQSRAALVAVLGTRPAIIAAGYFALAAFGYVHERPPVRFSDDEIVNFQGRWDATWYLDIATQGYRYRADTPAAQQNIVFFPAFPLALRVVGRMFGGSVAAHLFGGTALTWIAFLFGLTYLFRLARDLLGSTDQARAAVLFVATYPFALYYGAVYTESVYLLAAVAAFYHARRFEYWQTAAWGLLAGFTRPNGCFLSLPLALVTASPWLPHWLSAPAAGYRLPGAAAPVARSWRRLAAAFASAAAPGIAVLTYSAFVWQLTGNPIAWAEGHAAWGRAYVGFGTLISTWYRYFHESGAYVVTTVLPYDSLNAMGALFVLALALPVWRRFGLPYALMILINMLPPLAAGGFLSAGRFSAVMFPVFLWLAWRVPETQRGAWWGSFMAIQALNATFFYTWREMF